MRELTRTEAIDLVGRGEAEQELPERMRADVRLLGGILGQVLRESGSPGLYDDVERLRLATIQAYTDESPEAFARADLRRRGPHHENPISLNAQDILQGLKQLHRERLSEQNHRF
jgi:phosphoenolpyruvate carboxylase